jgi:hypothetical protein
MLDRIDAGDKGVALLDQRPRCAQGKSEQFQFYDDIV